MVTTKKQPRRSLWMFGLESEEPTDEERRQHAQEVSQRLGVTIAPPPIPRAEDLHLRPPRIKPPDPIAEFCFSDNYERALHSHRDWEMAVRGQFPNPPDIVAHPRTEEELERVLEWCCKHGYAAIPYGGGSSGVGGFTPPKEGYDGVVTIDMDQFDRVLEIDRTSRAARIQAGVFGPALEDQLRPHGLTLRHFPQSFAGSTLGGWIATRSGGHYATKDTHIDDFVESVRMLTPVGWWETRRLPASGAGPSPDRLAIGSEGILGIITEAWMRIQVRPKYRATAGVTFPSWETGYEATRQIVQAKLWPANLRLLDPELARQAAGMDGTHALLIIGFESAELPQEWPIRQAVGIARGCGGHIDDSEIILSDTGGYTGHRGAIGAWRDVFIPRGGGLATGLGLVTGTVETCITWERWPDFDVQVREALKKALQEVCGGGTLNCRFTHVYTDGPAPYYSFAGLNPGLGREHWNAVKRAASDAILKAGGTITHHHAVGRMHRPWYDRERPEPFAQALRAAKRALDPKWVLNPGVLIDP
ncbi:MAG: FAD-binding oxidoreductase [Chloroflexi bacterium]|nr:FAD-binding oxidoreductase [Chloroflexota bacterium]